MSLSPFFNSFEQTHSSFRRDSPYIQKVVKPYDWTYTPNNYRGTLGGDRPLIVEETELKINYEKLKEQERILFFDEVILYEDELDDNGCSMLSSKLVRRYTRLFFLGSSWIGSIAFGTRVNSRLKVFPRTKDGLCGVSSGIIFISDL